MVLMESFEGSWCAESGRGGDDVGEPESCWQRLAQGLGVKAFEPRGQICSATPRSYSPLSPLYNSTLLRYSAKIVLGWMFFGSLQSYSATPLAMLKNLFIDLFVKSAEADIIISTITSTLSCFVPGALLVHFSCTLYWALACWAHSFEPFFRLATYIAHPLNMVYGYMVGTKQRLCIARSEATEKKPNFLVEGNERPLDPFSSIINLNWQNTKIK